MLSVAGESAADKYAANESASEDFCEEHGEPPIETPKPKTAQSPIKDETQKRRSVIRVAHDDGRLFVNVGEPVSLRKEKDIMSDSNHSRCRIQGYSYTDANNVEQPFSMMTSLTPRTTRDAETNQNRDFDYRVTESLTEAILTTPPAATLPISLNQKPSTGTAYH